MATELARPTQQHQRVDTRLREVSPDLHLVKVRVRLGNSADQAAEVAVLRPLKDDVQLVLLVVNVRS